MESVRTAADRDGCQSDDQQPLPPRSGMRRECPTRAPREGGKERLRRCDRFRPRRNGCAVARWRRERLALGRRSRSPRCHPDKPRSIDTYNGNSSGDGADQSGEFPKGDVQTQLGACESARDGPGRGNGDQFPGLVAAPFDCRDGNADHEVHEKAEEADHHRPSRKYEIRTIVCTMTASQHTISPPAGSPNDRRCVYQMLAPIANGSASTKAGRKTAR